MNKKYENIQNEIDASFFYDFLYHHENNITLKELFREMRDIENRHAKAFIKKYNLEGEHIKPSFRARLIVNIGKIVGLDFVLGILMDTEKRLSLSILNKRNSLNNPSSFSDTSHVAIMRGILAMKNNINETEKKILRSSKVSANALRAAVLGGNDGLVSNFSLVMGVAGATHDNSSILLAGVAGLLAGALSMALGEWISVKSSQELYEKQFSYEDDELDICLDLQKKELELIYITKGFSKQESEEMAFKVISEDKQNAELLNKESLGIDVEEGSAIEAALSSFVFFAIGAIVPLLPFFWFDGYLGILLSAISGSIALFVIGAFITIFTGRSFVYSGLRQVIFGLLTALVTFTIGYLLGVELRS